MRLCKRGVVVVVVVVAAVISHCNSLLHGISDILQQRLQAVQNAAARLVTVSRWYDHIHPIIERLHWLPARQRVEFKLAVLRSTTWHHQCICQTIVSSLPPPGAVSFNHQIVPSALSLAQVHVSEIQPSPLPDHAFGTVFPHMSIGSTCPWTLSL